MVQSCPQMFSYSLNYSEKLEQILLMFIMSDQFSAKCGG